MTRFFSMLLLLCALLTGCGQAETAETPEVAPTPPSVEETAPPTETDVLDFFAADPYYENYEVTDCVLADDGACDLIGVVQYTNEEENPCYYAFVDSDGFCIPVGIGAVGELEIAPGSQLAYLGNGTVSFSVQETTPGGKLLDYEIEFSRLEDGVNFKVSSQERS